LGNLRKDGEEAPIKVEKRFIPSLDRSVLKADYRITHLGEEKRRTNFGIEFNINLLAGDAPDRYFDIPGLHLEDRKLASLGELEDISEVRLIDEWDRLKIILKIDKNCNFWRFPVETVSLSESGFEKIFQGSCLFFYWPLELEPKGQFEVGIELGVYPL
jgi:alpha-amylase